jgi:Primase C terminal 1 (PriCT-1)
LPLDSIGLWHDARPAVLDRALLTARRACPNLSAFANFMLPHLPKSTIASHNIRSTDVEPYSEQASLGYAITLPWFALDNETYTNAIVIDADHPNGLERAEYIASQFHIPRPTVVSDPWSGFSHIVWLLAAPVHVGAAKANRYLRFAGQLLALAVGGTHLGRRALVKSPWGRRANLEGKLRRRTDTPCWMWQIHQASGSQLIWHTTPGDQQAVALRDIVAALEPAYGVTARALKPAREPNAEREPSQAGRNCELFDRTRFWAYEHHCSDEATLVDYATTINRTFAQPLSAKEVAGIVKSIAGYMATHDGRARKRGRDTRAGIGLTTLEKQQLGARLSAGARRAKTDSTLATAWLKLKATGRRVTQAALAAASGFCLNTIKSRWASLRKATVLTVKGRFAFR